MAWKVTYLESVENWLNLLDKKQFKSVARELKLLELSGNELRLPHSKSLGDGLFELRERNYGFRIYYTFDKEAMVLLLHAGDKSSQVRDIKRAKELVRQYRGSQR